jgi:hypothetical protein
LKAGNFNYKNRQENNNMTIKPARLSIIRKIFMLFVLVNIIGDIGNVAFWWANSASRAASLNTGYLGVTAGIGNALIAGTIILLVVAAVYMIAFIGLMKRIKWAHQLIIIITVVNRALALILYFISPAFVYWAVWSIILIVLAYFDWSKMNSTEAVT